MHVSLLDVDLGARNATDAVGVTIIVRARGGILVLPHGSQIQGRVAPASSAGEVDGVPKREAQQVERHVVLVAVGSRSATHRKVGPGIHVDTDRAVVGNLHWHGAVLRAPPGRHDLRRQVGQAGAPDLHHAGTLGLWGRAGGGTLGGGAALGGSAAAAGLRGRDGGTRLGGRPGGARLRGSAGAALGGSGSSAGLGGRGGGAGLGGRASGARRRGPAGAGLGGGAGAASTSVLGLVCAASGCILAS
mmetsp:Transcript_1953/g.5107  ORF Transcript_1953/g.5107 Transcript_1953/m.5107 type:complete len:246 (-) Transcript_1953:1032-1769(-)